MNRQVSFTIYEKPMALKRHRTTKSGVAYDSQKKDKLYIGILIKKYLEEHSITPDTMLQGPIAIDMKFYFPLPKTPAARKNKGLYHISKPDCDNCQKMLLDVLSGILYADDAIVYKINAIKCYTTNRPRTEVVIKEVPQEPILEEYNAKPSETFFPARTP